MVNSNRTGEKSSVPESPVLHAYAFIRHRLWSVNNFLSFLGLHYAMSGDKPFQKISIQRGRQGSRILISVRLLPGISSLAP
jgi:hypothetical protein